VNEKVKKKRKSDKKIKRKKKGWKKHKKCKIIKKMKKVKKKRECTKDYCYNPIHSTLSVGEQLKLNSQSAQY